MRNKLIAAVGALATIVVLGGAPSRALGSATELYSVSAANGFSQVSLLPSLTIATDGQVVGEGIPVGGANDHALLWTSSGIVVDLHPTGFTSSIALTTNGTQQSGYGTINGNDHALLWNGTAASAVDLNPAGFSFSQAYGAGGGQQVGLGGTSASSPSHALLWTGTASAIDLNPAGYAQSEAYSTDGVHQVGQGFGHAMLWSGTASSAVDLHPSWLAVSDANGVSGNQQVGSGWGAITGNNFHALLWTGTADSAVDLNPAGFSRSFALGTNGSLQIGIGADTASNDNYHALVWNGTAASSLDLQTLLPSNVTWTSSYADSIDADGNIFGIAYGTQGGNNVAYAVEWTGVPEPASISIFALLAIGLLIRRRGRIGGATVRPV